MKLLAYEVDKRSFLGVLNEDETWVYPVSAAGMEYRSMKDLIREAGPSEMEMLDYISKKMPGDVIGAAPVEEIKVVSPIAEPDQDIICLGINYMDHAKESARFKKEEFSKPEKAIYFSKRVNRTNDPDGIIPAHKNLTNQLDYEAELAVIIKKDAKDVKPGEVKDYIFGYTIMNDVSAREIQNRHKQWYFGKSLDGSTPMGPYLVTADEFAFPPKLDICSRVNGELSQNSNTEKQIFKIDYVIEELSRGMTLEAGSVIATGTPSGVGMGFVPPKFLKEGDVVECEIEGIGVLRNPIGK